MFLRFFTIATMCCFWACASTHASVMIHYIGGEEFSNSGANDITSNAIQLTFDDGGTAGSVQLTVDFLGGTGVDEPGAHLNDLFLNVDDGLSGFGFTHISGVNVNSTNFTSNFHGSGGSHGWDILIDFRPPNNNHSGDKFLVGMQSVFDITAAGLTTSSFFGNTNVSGHGPFEAMAHVNAIDNGESGHYADSVSNPPPPAVPEPGALLIWTVLLSAASLRRNK